VQIEIMTLKIRKPFAEEIKQLEGNLFLLLDIVILRLQLSEYSGSKGIAFSQL